VIFIMSLSLIRFGTKKSIELYMGALDSIYSAPDRPGRYSRMTIDQLIQEPTIFREYKKQPHNIYLHNSLITSSAHQAHEVFEDVLDCRDQNLRITLLLTSADISHLSKFLDSDFLRNVPHHWSHR
jgi:hypothetical protein